MKFNKKRPFFARGLIIALVLIAAPFTLEDAQAQSFSDLVDAAWGPVASAFNQARPGWENSIQSIITHAQSQISSSINITDTVKGNLLALFPGLETFVDSLLSAQLGDISNITDQVKSNLTAQFPGLEALLNQLIEELENDFTPLRDLILLDINEANSILVGQVTSAIEDSIGQVGAEISQIITDQVGAFIGEFPDVGALNESLKTQLRFFEGVAALTDDPQAITDVANSLITTLPRLIATLPALLESYNTISEQNELFQRFIERLPEILETLPAIQEFRNQLPLLVTELTTDFIQNVPEIVENLPDLIDGKITEVGSVLQTDMKTLVIAASPLPDEVKDAIELADTSSDEHHTQEDEHSADSSVQFADVIARLEGLVSSLQDQTQATMMRRDFQRLGKELLAVRAQIDQIRSDNEVLREENQFLENAQLMHQLEALRSGSAKLRAEVTSLLELLAATEPIEEEVR